MKELLKTPIFKVVELDEVEPGFRPIGVDAPDWVSVIVEKNNQFLVVNQLRYGIMKETLEFPSGTVEKDENPRDAAARELLEETGIKVDKTALQCICKCSPNPAFMMNTKYVYYVNLDCVNHTEEEQHLDEHEHITYKWADKIKLTKMMSEYSSNPNVPAMFGTALLAYWDFKGLFDALTGVKKCLM